MSYQKTKRWYVIWGFLVVLLLILSGVTIVDACAQDPPDKLNVFYQDTTWVQIEAWSNKALYIDPATPGPDSALVGYGINGTGNTVFSVVGGEKWGRQCTNCPWVLVDELYIESWLYTESDTLKRDLVDMNWILGRNDSLFQELQPWW